MEIVGTDAIRQWLKLCPPSLPDDFPVPLDDLEKNYFGNKWGAFGQYYGGAEYALRLIKWTEDGLPGLVTPRGPELAAAFRGIADRVRFQDLLNDRQPRVKDFRRVGSELSFAKISDIEKALFRQMFFDSTNVYGAEGARRTNTLLLLLSIAQQSKKGVEDPAWSVLKIALYGCSDDMSFVCPPALLRHLELWRIYALHELVAFSLEVFLVVCVEQVARLEMDFVTPAQSVAEVTEYLANLLPEALARASFGELMGADSLKVRYSSSDAPTADFEEINLRTSANKALKEGDLGAALICALKLLARLSAQLGIDHSAYEIFRPDTSLDPQRLSLNDVSRFGEENKSLTVAEAAKYWISLAANTHLRVATAKLAYNKDFTYKIVFEGGRLRKIKDTEPTFSRPRLSQAAQMLSDVGFLKFTGDNLSITSAGIDLLRSHGCSI